MIGNQPSLTNNVASKTISVTASGSQTLFTVTGGYRINQLAVYRNGTRLVDSLDYTARDGATVTLLSPASGSDVIEFQVFDDFRVADALDVNSGGTVNGNVTVTGSVTAGSFSGNITGTAATFTGNVTIGGTLTYEDVTNIDSVGLITARSGIQFGSSGVGGTVTAVGNATFTGIVTASSFVGNVTGNLTGNVTGDATGLSGTPNLNIGITTATQLFEGSARVATSGKAVAMAMIFG